MTHQLSPELRHRVITGDGPTHELLDILARECEDADTSALVASAADLLRRTKGQLDKSMFEIARLSDEIKNQGLTI